jgi:hypothetical protein
MGRIIGQLVINSFLIFNLFWLMVFTNLEGWLDLKKENKMPMAMIR